jgi:membrane protease YdiL (CAAX protease family)
MDMSTPGEAPLKPYGPWVSVALTAAVLLGASLLAEGLVIAAAGMADGKSAAGQLRILASTSLAGVIGTAAIAALVGRRAPGRLREYLALHGVDGGDAWRWLTIIVAYVVFAVSVQYVARTVFGIKPPPNPLDGVEVGPLFVTATVLIAPVFEESLFRGFLMKGLLPSRLGYSGALAVTTLLWSVAHYQYDLIGVALVFGCGVILGLARLKTGSLPLSIAMHMTFNATSILLSILLQLG